MHGVFNIKKDITKLYTLVTLHHMLMHINVNR